MIEHDQDRHEVAPIGTPAQQREELPYCIELWDAANRASVERILARSVNATLARAIFKAARNEYPSRRITLRRGSRIIEDSAIQSAASNS
jgi:ribosomal protein S3AE